LRAAAIVEKGIVQQPASADLHNLSGNLSLHRGQLEAAIAAYRRALAIDPAHPEANYNCGIALLGSSRPAEALERFDAALRARPDYPAALNHRGSVLLQLGRPAEALASYERTLQLAPELTAVWIDKGRILRNAKRFEEALAAFDRARATAPDHLDLLNDLGLVLRDLKRPVEALAAFDRALQLKPDFAEAMSNRGLILQELDRFDEALAAYDRSLQLRADLADTHANRGNALQELARHDEALVSYRRALEIKPGYEAVYLNESLSRLVSGDLSGGWPQYEWRWQNNSEVPPERQFSEPLWLGKEPLDGKTILIYAEQGPATRSSSAATPGRWPSAARPCCCGCSRRSCRCCRDSTASPAFCLPTSRPPASTSTVRCSACRSLSTRRCRPFPRAAPTSVPQAPASTSGWRPGRRASGRRASRASAWSGRATSITRTTATARSRCKLLPAWCRRRRASSRCRTKSARPTRRC
jgi:tetratricopeptide (TPR) repeat protein